MRYAILAAFVALSAGCVPVTEPLGDIDKAEPDKALIGDWGAPDSTDDKVTLVIDIPEVKGNPKGLLRALNNGEKDMALWFYTTTIGKHRYANIILDREGGLESAQFAKEGEFAKWKKDPAQRFFIFHYTIDGDKLVVDSGNEKVVKMVMTDAKIARAKGNDFFYETPAGWLAKYLDKNDPKVIFDGSNTNKYHRLKKK